VPAHHGVDLTALAKRRADQEKVGGAASEATEERPDDSQPWEIPVLLTSAHDGEGVPELLEMLESHYAIVKETGELAERRARRLLERVRAVVDRGLRTQVWRDGDGEAILEAARADLESGSRTPYEVAAEILRTVSGGQ
jgi:LAO/AO transport system kinase